MFQSYLKTTVRNLRKNIFHSFLNIFGLTTGLLFTFLIGSYIWNELKINRNLRNADRQYFLKSTWKDPNLGVDITTLGPLAKQLKENYPSLIANYYRWDGITSIVSRGNKHFRENIQLGDSTLLSMFGLKLLEGDALTALHQPFSAIITPEIAFKYFGTQHVVGESITIQNFGGDKRDFTVTGVLDNVAENSVTRLNSENNNTIFIPTNTFSFFGRMDFENWSNFYLPSYIELKPGVDPETLQPAIRKLLDTHASPMIKSNLTIEPISLTSFYLNKDDGLVRRMLYTLSGVGLFLLIMAVINFINISVSSSSARVKEMGIRKVLGGMRRQLIMQFLVESIQLVFIATVLAIVLYPIVQPSFETMIGKDIPQLSDFPIQALLIPILATLLIGLLAGIYPAFALSAMNSIDSLKGKLKTVNEKVGLRKSLIGFQFSIAAIVMVAAFVITQQVDHFFGRSLGYNKEFIVSSQVPRDWTPAGVQKMEAIRDQLALVPDVKSVSLSYEIPNGMNGGQPMVYKPGTDSTQALAMQSLVTDANYLNTYEIPMAAGRFFNRVETDSTKVILNEIAVKALGWEYANSAIGQQLRMPGTATVFTISGVTRDFHFGSMHKEIAPSIFLHVKLANVYRFLSFKINSNHISEAIESIQSKWAILLPGSSFEYSFMDDTLQKLYSSELQLKKAAYTASIMAMIIVLLGVLGLVSISVQKRMKEIALRKVLGASASGIVSLFLKEFLPVMTIGGIISIPIAWFVMNGWLDNYAYRIDLTFIPFIITILFLILVISLIITLRILKASTENPVKNFRIE